MKDWTELDKEVEQILGECLVSVKAVTTDAELAVQKAKYLGKNESKFKSLLQHWRKLLVVLDSDKKKFGRKINDLRAKLVSVFEKKKIELRITKKHKFEITEKINLAINKCLSPIVGSHHIFCYERARVARFFRSHNFSITEGSEIDSVYNNFELLNISKHHVSSEQTDTFFIKNIPGYLLRTHCTNGTAFSLSNRSKHGTKISKTLTFGKAFRKDTHDATHLHEFYQLDGCMIGTQWNIATLKHFLDEFLHFYFNTTVESRWRVSYFPFTSPSFEIDVRCFQCANGCVLCKYTTWIEILGAGVIHPEVIRRTSVVLAPNVQVVAFGMGLERIMMLKYRIFDIRALYNHDVRWLMSMAKS